MLSLIDRCLAGVEKLTLCISLAVMLIVAFLQVILRNFFHSGIEWADILTRHLVLLLLFFGASLATRDRRHIQMDISAKIVPARLKLVFELIINFFCIYINLLLAKAAYTFMLDEKMAGDILFLNVPNWAFAAIMPVGFIFISLRFLLNSLQVILALMGKGTYKPSEHHGMPVEEAN